MAEYMKPTEAADALGISLKLLRAWADSGRIRVAGKTPGGHRRYLTADIEEMKRLDAERTPR